MSTDALPPAPDVEKNTELWRLLHRTDPSATKRIVGKPYDGTSPSPYWIVGRLTETFGPIGIGWGFKVLDERMEKVGEHEIHHIAHVELWYKWQGQTGFVEQYGQTKQAYLTAPKGNQPARLFTDEDAAKKSVTDAFVKCASYLGVAGDIFSGQWDDSKYQDENAEYWAEQKGTKAKPDPKPGAKPGAQPGAKPAANSPPPTTPDQGKIAETALEIERATTDRQLNDLMYTIWQWHKNNLVKPETTQELGRSAIRRRSGVIDLKNLPQFQKVLETYRTSGICTQAETDVAYNLARTRLNAVDPPASTPATKGPQDAAAN